MPKWVSEKQWNGEYRLMIRIGDYIACYVLDRKYIKEKGYVRKAKNELLYMAAHKVVTQ